MKKLILISLALIGLSSCDVEHVRDTDVYYYDLDCKLVEKSKCGESKTMLIRIEDKDFMYRELTNNDLVNDEMYYSYDVGDIMRFKYLRKDAFFGVDPEEDEFKERF